MIFNYFTTQMIQLQKNKFLLISIHYKAYITLLMKIPDLNSVYSLGFFLKNQNKIQET